MKASDLLNAEVVDESGRRLGKVHDLRVTRPSASSPWQLEAVVVGSTGLAHRFGYATGEVRGPAVLAKAAHWLARRRQIIEWSRVISYDQRTIVARAPHPGSVQP
ncbi:PRC-barrel domain-containing protein [Streptomyces sp. ISL-10]|uniref:PRC-barrel domain-containing protein n=1 Tax=Streptomyces sp. ISL-10 TaxID=2819172 RepID=UPI001BE551C9|nr:PRC-barrel domain-containing protein [Streptomyces sp. ISL-10]MBT2367282.1 PRC-barrel domain-containing protein [Streptomyces sp. ISL-10]